MTEHVPLLRLLTAVPTAGGLDKNVTMLNASESGALWYEGKGTPQCGKRKESFQRAIRLRKQKLGLLEMIVFMALASFFLHWRVKDQSHFHVRWVLNLDRKTQ